MDNENDSNDSFLFAKNRINELIINNGLEENNRQVCQYQFKKNDIVWICRQCQTDETCVLCNNCYQDSNHEGHEVFFYHSQAGGCCDCGDCDAWCIDGFCKKHGQSDIDPLESIPLEIQSLMKPLLHKITYSSMEYCAEYSQIFDINHIISIDEINDTDYGIIIQNDEIHNRTDVSIIIKSIKLYKDNKFGNIGIKFSELVDNIIRKLISGSCIIYLTDLDSINKENINIFKEIACYLTGKGLCAGFTSTKIIEQEKEIISIFDWLFKIVQKSDSISRMVCNSLEINILTKILETEAFLSKFLVKSIHNLFLTLMADHKFKKNLSIAYAKGFTKFSHDFGRGIGMNENCVYTLSVQFLNRDKLVNYISDHCSFLTTVANALESIFNSTLIKDIDNDTQIVDLTNPAIVCRRYNHVIADMRIIFTISGKSRQFLFESFSSWLRILILFQYVHKQKRIRYTLVHYDKRDWIFAFNLYLSLASLFDPLVNWFEQEDSVGDVNNIEYINEKKSSKLIASTVLANTFYSIIEWQDKFSENYIGENIICSTGINCNMDQNRDKYVEEIISLLNFQNEFSFHIYLHRFFSTCINELLKHRHHMPTLEYVHDMINKDSFQLSLLIDLPLINLVMTSQIKHNMWVRNGQEMDEQVLNYTEAPYCCTFMDLDLLLIQFCGVMYGSNKLLTHIFYRFSCLGYINNKILEFEDETIEHVRNLLDDSLLLIILLVTEIPLPSCNDYSNKLITVRRCIIHSLVSGPKTYSQLLECYITVSDYAKIPIDKIELIINELTETRDDNIFESPKLYLKTEYWREYDPSYPKLSQTLHQQAFENMPVSQDAKSNYPMVQKFQNSHEIFKSFRVDILLNPILLSLLKDLSMVYLINCDNNDKKSDYGFIQQQEWQMTCNDNTFNRILHLFTLIFHVLDFYKDDKIIKERMSSYLLNEDISENISDKIKTTKEENDVTNPNIVGESSNKNSATTKSNNHCFTIDLSDVPLIAGLEEDSMANSVPLNINNSNNILIPSLLCTLINISDTLVTRKDQDNKRWLGWIINQCSHVSESCFNYIKDRNEKKLFSQRLKDMDARKKRARDKAMLAMNKNASSFTVHMEAIANSSEKTDELSKDVYEDSINSISDSDSDSNDSNIITCIVCQLNTADDICYLAYGQSSKVVNNRIKTLHIPSKQSNDLLEKEKLYMHASFCGHAMHLHCFDSYFASIISKNGLSYMRDANMNDLLLDTNLNQFPCPLCRTLCNSCIPCFNDKHENSNSKLSRVTCKNNLRKDIKCSHDNQDQDSFINWIDNPILITNQTSKGNITANVDSTESNLINLMRDDNCMMNISYRILTDFCIPIHGKRNGWIESWNFQELSKDILSHIETALACVSYTHLIEMMGENNNLLNDNPINKVIDLVSETIFAYNIHNDIHNILMNEISGDDNDINLSISDRYERSNKKNENWLVSLPLLAMPLLDCVHLSISIIKIPNSSLNLNANLTTNNSNHLFEFEASVKWLIIAKLVQLLLSFNEYDSLIDDKDIDTWDIFAFIKNILNLIHSTKIGDNISLSMKMVTDIDTTISGTITDCDIIGENNYKSTDKNIDSNVSNNDRERNSFNNILLHWISFIDTTNYSINSLNNGDLIRDLKQQHEFFTNDIINNELLNSYINCIGLDSILSNNNNKSNSNNNNNFEDNNEIFIKDINFDSSNSQSHHHKIFNYIEKWLFKFYKYKFSNSSNDIVNDIIYYRSLYPPIKKPTLITMPNSYTIFHSTLSSICNYEFPCVCMSCGAVLDASGKGHCASHLALCSPDNGLIFLLQDCEMLLFHGTKRCSYFTSPYVDDHGEKLRQFRRKPLYADQKKYEKIVSLWIKHKIAREVYSKRSNSNRIVIFGHY